MRMKVAVLFTLYVWCIFTARASRVDWKTLETSSKEFKDVDRILQMKDIDEDDLYQTLETLQENIKHEYEPGKYEAIKNALGSMNAYITKDAERSGELRVNDSASFTQFQICCEVASNAEKIGDVACRIRAQSSEADLWYTIVAYHFRQGNFESKIEIFFVPVQENTIPNVQNKVDALKKEVDALKKWTETEKEKNAPKETEEGKNALKNLMIVILILLVVYLLYRLNTMNTGTQNERPQMPDVHARSQVSTNDAQFTPPQRQDSSVASSNDQSNVTEDIGSETNNTELISNDMISLVHPVTHSFSSRRTVSQPETISVAELPEN